MSQVNILPIPYMAINLYYIISRQLDISEGANYSFSEYPQSDEQFAAIFTKIGATLFFQPCTIWIFTFDL